MELRTIAGQDLVPLFWWGSQEQAQSVVNGAGIVVMPKMWLLWRGSVPIPGFQLHSESTSCRIPLPALPEACAPVRVKTALKLLCLFYSCSRNSCALDLHVHNILAFFPYMVVILIYFWFTGPWDTYAQSLHGQKPSVSFLFIHSFTFPSKWLVSIPLWSFLYMVIKLSFTYTIIKFLYSSFTWPWNSCILPCRAHKTPVISYIWPYKPCILPLHGYETPVTFLHISYKTPETLLHVFIKLFISLLNKLS